MSIKAVFDKTWDCSVLLWEKIQSSSRILFIIAWLFLLYTGVLIFSVITLSCYQIQSELKGSDKDKNLYELRTIWALYENEKKSRHKLNSNLVRKKYSLERTIRYLKAPSKDSKNYEKEEKEYRDKLNTLEDENKDLDGQIERIEKKNAILAAIETFEGEYGKNEEVADVFSLVAFSEGLGLYFFILLPVEILTLFLTLSMGVLGSTILINREFFNPSENRRVFWYLYRPALGMATALTVFILFRAGQLSISGPSGGAPADSMNAFMVSFLAVISGLLSEDAYLWIVRTGQKFFKTAPKDKRYANPHAIRQQLTEKNITESAMANFVNVEPQEVDAWLNVEKLVMYEYQEKISEMLDKPIEDLFFN